MKDIGNLYARAALSERRDERASEMKDLRSRLRHLQQSLVHVDATLLLFDPDAAPAGIKPKKPCKRVKLFGQGKLNRMILDTLRKAEQPMRTPEIVEAIAAESGLGAEASNGVKDRVRSNLTYLSKVRGAVVKDGDRETINWRLAGESNGGRKAVRLWPGEHTR